MGTHKCESLDVLVMQVVFRARSLFRLQQYSDALVAFSHAMALTETTDEDVDLEYLEMHGSMVHNIASCYHHLGALDVAQMYYEAAKADFRKALTTGSKANSRRLTFVNERLQDLNQCRMPVTGTYCDSRGTSPCSACQP